MLGEGGMARAVCDSETHQGTGLDLRHGTGASKGEDRAGGESLHRDCVDVRLFAMRGPSQRTQERFLSAASRPAVRRPRNGDALVAEHIRYQLRIVRPVAHIAVSRQAVASIINLVSLC